MMSVYPQQSSKHLCILFIFFTVTLLAGDLPDGWCQLDMLSYHGPYGYFHDKVSGALVQYSFGFMPPFPTDVAGSSKCKTRAIKGVVPNCVMSVQSISKSQKKLQVSIGPIDSIYAFYWTEVNSPEQEERARSLMLQSPLWERSVAGQKVLEPEPQDRDVAALRVGLNIEEVYKILGYPMNLQPKSDAGFSAYYVIWSKHGPMKNWRSYQIELLFSKDRILQSLPQKILK